MHLIGDVTSLHKKPGWSDVKNATRGRLAFTGSAFYLITVLFWVLKYMVTDFGIRDSNMYPIVLMAVSFDTIFGIVSLINHTERLSKEIKR